PATRQIPQQYPTGNSSMSKHDDDIAGSQPASSETPPIPQQPGRRRFLGSMAALSAGTTLAACATEGQGPVPYPSGNPA
ncbi:hypothetical protein, partial [Klebsiella pneumoniae]|uniref:hypothetical protein n=1 Tax=Klebsiella pneumoniae TaxID=573 RepID=UPI003CF998DD